MHALVLMAALALGAAPAKSTKTQLKLDIKPAAAVVFLDGKRVGDGSKERTVTVTPGRHALKVVHKGDEHQEMISVKKGETKQWKWAFEDDRPGKRSAELPTDETSSDEAGEKTEESTEVSP